MAETGLMPRRRRNYCKVRVNQHGVLYFDLFWDRRWKESAGYRDTPDNRRKAERFAAKVSADIAAGLFNPARYLMRFGADGKRAHEFLAAPPVARTAAADTVAGFFESWSLTLAPPKVRQATAAQYRSALRKHVLPTLGPKRIRDLQWHDLAMLQDSLRQHGTGTAAINRALHHALRAMLRDAARSRIDLAPGLYDRRFWQRLPESPDSNPDPFTPEERDRITEHFRGQIWFSFVYFQFWQGARPGEAIALRRGDVDLTLGTAVIRRSRVGGSEARTKTRKSMRTIRLHPNTVEVLRAHWPAEAKAEDYLFTSRRGKPLNEQNFYQRVWLPALKVLGIRERPFRNTRHSYVSLMLSIGKRAAFVSEQTGHSIRTMERHYKRYFPAEDDLVIPGTGHAAATTSASRRAHEGRRQPKPTKKVAARS